MPSDSNRTLEEQLYDATVEALLAKVRSGEASAADVGVAVKFLKDNEITADKDKHPGLRSLAKDLPFPGEKVY